MAFDQATRNRLASFVGDVRVLLTQEFNRQLQNEYGLDPDNGTVTELEKLAALDDARRETARILRETMDYYLAGNTADAKARRDVLQRIVRDQAFTVLNRLCALRMAEARGILIQSVAEGYQSKGFQLYARLAGAGLGETGDAYRSYLFSLFDEFGVDLAVLFDRFSPEGRLFPRQTALTDILDLLNSPEIDLLWAEDETIGWIYQYFNSREERQEMRAASPAPRNSHELAVRNQFFTPRYVVEFLTDNTLGRIWYEMTKGQTALKNSCRYLVRRPAEVFLKEDEQAPAQAEADEDLSQQKRLQQPAYIPHRAVKDPREIKMLDPACGSMHFGLYAFDLFEQMYAEAWGMEEKFGADALWRRADLDALHDTYPDRRALLQDVPRLIIERNIHGVDIDPRAVQIAGLSLWLRAHRSWQMQAVKPRDRPQIRRSNIVCAEPMPGDGRLLEEFLHALREDRLKLLMRKVLHLPNNQEVRVTTAMADALASLVRTVWKEMDIAGDAGSLLKIEATLRGAVEAARDASEETAPLFRVLEFDTTPSEKDEPKNSFSDPDRDFWSWAEGLVLAALGEYAETSDSEQSYRRCLFANDAVEGFAFLDLCRNRYDLVVMNPPFGELAVRAKDYIFTSYPHYKYDIYAAFVIRGLGLLSKGGYLGAITSRTGFFLKTLEDWRKVLINEFSLSTFADLGLGVLDAAMVEACCFVVKSKGNIEPLTEFINCVPAKAKGDVLRERIATRSCILVNTSSFLAIPNTPFAYWSPAAINEMFAVHQSLRDHGFVVRQGLGSSDNFRFLRLWWEVPAEDIGFRHRWASYAKGGGYQPFWGDQDLLVNWSENGGEIKQFSAQLYGSWSKQITNVDYYGRVGLTYASRTSSDFAPRVLPAASAFDTKGSCIFDNHGPDQPDRLLKLLAILQSRVFRYLLNTCVATSGDTARSYTEALVEQMPMPKLEQVPDEVVAGLRLVIDGNWLCEQLVENTHAFRLPHLSMSKFSELKEHIGTQISLADARYGPLLEEIDASISQAYGISHDTYDSLIRREIKEHGLSVFDRGADVSRLAALSLVSWLIGILFGRWDIRCAFGKTDIPAVRDPFAALPVCSKGLLQNATGYPAIPQDLPIDYPFSVAWNGIEADDAGTHDGIVDRVREAMRTLWLEEAESVEQDVCLVLGVSGLQEYVRKSDGFFVDHLRAYSKSRRQAPIYWPLSTPSNSFTLWLYYHRLNSQTLFTCVNDFVEPKLKQVSEEASRLRQKKGRGLAEERELERFIDFESELKDFRDELLGVAKFWKPNLNDGVQITAAPLWKLFQHRPWKKKLKETWESLEAGKYDWAHLAYSIWPERVREKCTTDKSLAIAHNLEYLYVEPKIPVKKTAGRKSKAAIEMEEMLDED